MTTIRAAINTLLHALDMSLLADAPTERVDTDELAELVQGVEEAEAGDLIPYQPVA